MTLRALSLSAVSTRKQTDGVSLEAQQADNIRTAEQHGWQVVDTLIVAGHSRRYSSMAEAAAAMRRKKIDAFDRLIQHLQAKDFDILLCRDGNRFARKQSLFAQIVETIIEGGARIYTMLDGMVDERNYTMFIAMSGYRAAQEINENVKKQGEGKRARLAGGLPEARAPHYMIPIRDTRTGESVDYRYDERYAPLWQALKTELLAGTNWLEIDYAVSEKHGVCNPKTGKPFGAGQLRAMVYTPLFWGHLAGGHRKTGAASSTWIYDETLPPPEGVTVQRNRFPGIYQGADRATVIAELRRRQGLKGHASSKRSHMFSGLFVCQECGYTATTHITPASIRTLKDLRIRCPSRFMDARRALCSNHKMIKYADAQAYLNELLEDLINTSPEQVFSVQTASPDTTAALRSEKTQLERQMRNIIEAQRDLPDDASDVIRLEYVQQLREKDTRWKQVNNQLTQAQSQQAARQAELEAQQFAVDEIRTIGLDNLWLKETREINQLLHRVLGAWRLTFTDGSITGLKYTS